MQFPVRFMKAATLFAAFVVFGSAAWAADPVKVKPGGFADVTVTVPEGGSVLWRYSTPPVQKAGGLVDGRTVFGGTPGTTITATAITVAVDFEKKRTSLTEQDFTFVFEGAPATAPPVTPPTNPPTNPPVVPVPTDSLYFLIVRADGPAQPSFTAIMSLSAWGDVRKAGHSVRDMTATDAAKLGFTPAVSLPAVYTLQVLPPTADRPKGGSVVVRDAVPLPADNAGVTKLMLK